MLQKDASFVLMPSTQTNTGGNSNTQAPQSVSFISSSRILSHGFVLLLDSLFDLHVTILLIEVSF